MEYSFNFSAKQFAELIDSEINTQNESKENYTMNSSEILNAIRQGQVISVQDEKINNEVHLITTSYRYLNDIWHISRMIPVFFPEDHNMYDGSGDTFVVKNFYFEKIGYDATDRNKFIFQNCVFNYQVGSKDTQEITSRYCIFIQGLELSGSKNLEFLEFEGCVFEKTCTIRSCVVGSEIYFGNNSFVCNLRISNTNIDDNLTFYDNRFANQASLVQITTNGYLTFSENECSSLSIDKCTFNSCVLIDNGNFENRLVCTNSRFNGASYFNNLSFVSADFGSNEYNSVIFTDCSCQKEISFTDSRFESDVLMNRVSSERIGFIKSKIMSTMEITNSSDDPNDTGHSRVQEDQDISVDVLDFRESVIMGHLLIRNCYDKISLSDARMSGELDLDWNYLNVYRGNVFRRIRKDCRITDLDSIMMIKLYESMMNNKRYDVSDNYYVAHMLLKRSEYGKNGKTSPGRMLLSYMHEFISGFGKSEARLLAFSLMLILIFSFLYYAMGLGRLADCGYFSGITFFTIGYTEVGILNYTMKAMAIFEGFCGVFCMSYLVAILTKRH
ncbi:MAG: potassium channel family protein [Candidatus Methanomethylophilaceae archaeon]